MKLPNKIKRTNPNNRFNAMLNFGGSSGSHRHPFGVQERTDQHFLAYSLSLTCAKRLFSSTLLVDGDSFTSSLDLRFWPTATESGGGILVSFSFSPAMSRKQGIQLKKERDISIKKQKEKGKEESLKMP